MIQSWVIFLAVAVLLLLMAWAIIEAGLDALGALWRIGRGWWREQRAYATLYREMERKMERDVRRRP